MKIRWVALNLAGQRVGEPFTACTQRDAYDLGCGLYGPRCVTVQSLISWEQSEEDRSIAEKMRRLRYEED